MARNSLEWMIDRPNTENEIRADSCQTHHDTAA